jgi:acetyl/propionyl-CoA carboxylase alpha subunit/acetyl-CoA carboxylase carboxyltransferase component
MTEQNFSRIVILNRGEAAIRFMRAASTWSKTYDQPLETVALYTAPESSALFVRQAAHAVALGDAMVKHPAGGMRSAYLDIDRMIALIKENGATAVWPGWGFLAESAEFAEACENNGIKFVGPSAKSIRLLGDKVEAKALAERHGVPVTGWSNGVVRDVAHAKELAKKIGYPLLIKASAGGGGRGIRIVHEDAGLAEAFESASNEAASAFGNADCLMEQLVPEARHVEVQVIADQHGTVWAMGTRDCSVQRRHQKLIEEAPAPGLSPELEASICNAAVAVAKASEYEGAGTAEFLLVPSTGEFYFLEMNTRLQVEHTITEEIYGVDLAVQQILVAQGEKLPSDKPPLPRGTAIELRLNAENPDDHFTPSAGGIVRFESPQGPGIRVDSGFAAGDVVPTEFDSNIAKVIAWGANRREAWARLQTVLRDTVVAIEGGPTNRALLMELICSPALRAGPVTTKWLDGYLEERPAMSERSRLDIALGAASIGDHLRSRRGSVLNFLSEAQRGLPRRVSGPGATRLKYMVDGRPLAVTVATLGPSHYRVTCGEQIIELYARNTGDRTMVLEESSGERHTVIRIGTPSAVHVDVDGVACSFTRTSGGEVLAPIPAAVTRVHVEVGDKVKVGDRLVTLEVMKMESAVLSTQSGIVQEVNVGPAMHVAAGDLMLNIEAEADDDEDEIEPLLPLTGEQTVLSSLDLLRNTLLGYDLDEFEVDTAVTALEKGELEVTREQLTELIEVVLLQESLFLRGAFDDARNESGDASQDQLIGFIRHPIGDEDQLSEIFQERLVDFLAMHDVTGLRRSFQTEAALLRLFQSHYVPGRFHRLFFAVFDAMSRAKVEDDSTQERMRCRNLFERFAHFTVSTNRRLAQAVWQAIYVLFDGPRLQKDLAAEDHEAAGLLSRLVDPNEDEKSLAEARRLLVEMPLAPLLGLVAGVSQRPHNHRLTLLGGLLEHVHQVAATKLTEQTVDEVASYSFVRDDQSAFAGALIYEPSHLQVGATIAGQMSEMDLFLAFEPPEGQLREVFENIEGPKRVTCLWGNSESGLTARTFLRQGDKLIEKELYRDLHPNRDIVHELDRWEKFDLTRIPAPAGIILMNAKARDGSGDERLVAVGEIERFDPQPGINDPSTLYLPSFERVYLNAIYGISQALTLSGYGPFRDKKSNRNRMVWNRISLIFKPVVTLTQDDMASIAKRLSPWAPGLGLEKVVVMANFVKEGQPEEEARFMAVEWSDPTSRGSMLSIVKPWQRPHRVLSSYEQRVVEARRANKFFPYELVRTLTSDETGAGFGKGTFEELDLSEDGQRLISVKERPWGENQANLVVGKINNIHARFPAGLERILIIGDPTRSMGALAEPECARVIAAIDMAEADEIPVEWVPISSGAKIAFDSGTENLDWTARVLKRIIQFTQKGGVMNIIVDGVCVGAQSYWNAEATMLNHCRGALIMTGQGCMLLTGKRALEFSGSVAAPTNNGIGGLEDIMGPNGEAQYAAADLKEAYDILFRHYDFTYVPRGSRYVPLVNTEDPLHRALNATPYLGEESFDQVGDIFSSSRNPGRKQPFSIREVMGAVLDRDVEPLERWKDLDGGESAVVYHGQLGGCPLTCIGIESKAVQRRGSRPIDGPDQWTSGTLFPQSSRKVARAIQSASGVSPVLVLANLSGFDGSPESMRRQQLEFGAEIGRSVVNFDGPIIFCVISRYHGGAYVVFSQALNDRLTAVAVKGSYASVIGGGPAAAVVFPRLVKKRVRDDARIQEATARLSDRTLRTASEQAEFAALHKEVEAEIQGKVAAEFDAVHSVERAMEVGSLSGIVDPDQLRTQLHRQLSEGLERYLAETASA